MNYGRTGISGLSLSRSNILGVSVSAINMKQALHAIETLISDHNPRYITVTPAHVVMDAYHDEALRRIINNSCMTTPDGMSIVWLLKLMGYDDVDRVYGPDLMMEACRYGLARKWNHYFYGGDLGVAEALEEKLSETLPGLEVVGRYSPPFRQLTETEDQEIVNAINNAGADIIWIGLSSPKQEYWMAEHLGKIKAPVMIGVGAAFDFLSGNKPQAPRWIQRSGLEWFFRLASEPKRLWPRYRQYPRFVMLALAQLMGLREFPLEN